MIQRKRELNRLIERKENGLIKVITGMRRCGKSFLLFDIYHKYLNSIGVDDAHIIEFTLDDDENLRLRNPIFLGEYIRSLLIDKDKMYYVFLDEIQKVDEVPNPYVDNPNSKVGFVDVLLGLMRRKNVDVYVTGSNSKMLSSDVITEFRGRADEIRLQPLSFSEFYAAYNGDPRNAWQEYFLYGGLPYVMRLQSIDAKVNYLKNLFERIYLIDIIERYKLSNDKSVLDDLLDIISSSVGSLTNPKKLANTFLSERKINISDSTVAKYLDYFMDSFMIDKVKRYDVKGRKYIGAPQKYYFSDIGLRNSRLGFRQTEENHIMENIIYSELLWRGFSVDVGTVEYNYKEYGKSKRSQLEVDFIANKGSERYYIQSAFSVGEEEKRQQEIRPYKLIRDSFKKIVVVKDDIIPWRDEYGVFYIGIEKFLLDEEFTSG